jgi:hypothetical protein
MREFARPRHQLVWRVLESLDESLLSATKCYFGGGTRIVMELDEYRESIDVDFLCSDRAGYRELRGMMTQQSFGDLFSGDYQLMREIRSDMYGIRTFLLVDEQPLKFEIISEGRIPLTGDRTASFPVEVLDHTSAFAEKLLANTDRGRDASTRSRDLIDLAFMAASWSHNDFLAGMTAADSIYGMAVNRELEVALERIEDSAYRRNCVSDLAVSDTRKLGRGIRALRKLL